ncbi:MAG: protein-export chaperone SecB [Paracoccus sp. (in: a-proteobacteria)]|nr:protein-export chaperone SecB [Paracoccus sp. (in: a-proteobacteria)]
MTDETSQNGQNPAAAPQQPEQKQPAQPRMNILAQYIRDMSFENAVAQKGMASGADVKPEIAVQVALDARKRNVENQYEVICKFKVNSTNAGDKAPLFLCELEYAGVFLVEGVPEEQLHPFLMIECPRMMFPYIRRILHDVTRDGGFPALNLDPVDFVALYRNEIARRQQEQAAQAQGEKPADQPLN